MSETIKNERMTPEELSTEITEQITAVSQGFKRLMNSRLAKRTILLLIHDAIPAGTRGNGKYGKPGINDIERVINAAMTLEARHLKKEEQKK